MRSQWLWPYDCAIATTVGIGRRIAIRLGSIEHRERHSAGTQPSAAAAAAATATAASRGGIKSILY